MPARNSNTHTHTKDALEAKLGLGPLGLKRKNNEKVENAQT